MAVFAISFNYHIALPLPQSKNPNSSNSITQKHLPAPKSFVSIRPFRHHRFFVVHGCNGGSGSDPNRAQDEEVESLGVKAALSVLKFYKREISPLLPKSCRYVPTCSEYSMEAYKKYGVVKGTILTTWRLCRCNPLGGSGFDPPRWFDETSLPEEEE